MPPALIQIYTSFAGSGAYAGSLQLIRQSAINLFLTRSSSSIRLFRHRSWALGGPPAFHRFSIGSIPFKSKSYSCVVRRLSFIADRVCASPTSSQGTDLAVGTPEEFYQAIQKAKRDEKAVVKKD